jgi:hypothetical protein
MNEWVSVTSFVRTDGKKCSDRSRDEMAGKNVSDFQAHLVPGPQFVSESSGTGKLYFWACARAA